MAWVYGSTSEERGEVVVLWKYTAEMRMQGVPGRWIAG